jgi:predicted MPP superfamily phosphohydrolase
MQNEKLNQIDEILEGLKSEFYKFSVKGNNAAGTRARKKAQEIKSLLNDVRAEILSKQKGE